MRQLQVEACKAQLPFSSGSSEIRLQQPLETVGPVLNLHVRGVCMSGRGGSCPAILPRSSGATKVLLSGDEPPPPPSAAPPPDAHKGRRRRPPRGHGEIRAGVNLAENSVRRRTGSVCSHHRSPRLHNGSTCAVFRETSSRPSALRGRRDRLLL